MRHCPLAGREAARVSGERHERSTESPATSFAIPKRNCVTSSCACSSSVRVLHSPVHALPGARERSFELVFGFDTQAPQLRYRFLQVPCAPEAGRLPPGPAPVPLLEHEPYIRLVDG